MAANTDAAARGAGVLTSKTARWMVAIAGMASAMRELVDTSAVNDGFRVLALLLIVAAPLIWIVKKPQFKKASVRSGPNIRTRQRLSFTSATRRTYQKTKQLSADSRPSHM